MMLSIFICEDNPIQRESIEKIVSDYIAQRGEDIELALSTDDPAALLAYLKANPKAKSLYFLDVDLQHEMNGILLAKEIRERDLFGTIAFVTSHGELSYLTFRYHIEAIDYIVKGCLEEMTEKVHACIALAYGRSRGALPEQEYFQVKSGGQILNISLGEIMFVESHFQPHKLILHASGRRIEFYGVLKEIEGVHPGFYRCHKSFVVNVRNIRAVDKVNGRATMVDGQVVHVTSRKMTGLIQAMNQVRR